jgi:hypothetical protein
VPSGQCGSQQTPLRVTRSKNFVFGGERGASVVGCLDSLHSGYAGALRIQGWHGSLELHAHSAFTLLCCCLWTLHPNVAPWPRFEGVRLVILTPHAFSLQLLRPIFLLFSLLG